MSRVIILNFEYCNAVFYALVHCKNDQGYKEYKVVPADYELNTLFEGDGVIREEDGCLKVETGKQTGNYLMENIAKALGNLLGLPVKKISS